MKKHFYFFLAVLVCSLGSVVAQANPGDTTWVQANKMQMTNTTNYDTTVFFPNNGKTYRKIYMVFTLGKYQCPGTPQYCASYDYIVNNYAITKGGDTMEISRLITPYATTSTYFPLTWTYDYVYDVTDYATLLKDSTLIRIAYGGYSYGFTANVRFALIEGTPDRTVIGIHRLWHGEFNYGSTPSISSLINPITDAVPASTTTTIMKMRITGHGEDANDCNEFCPNTYDVVLNNSDILTQNFFRDNCGSNPVSPQTGTWPYNRAGWCPGALVTDIANPLPVTSGSYNVNITFPAYTTVMSSTGNSNPYYDIEAAAIYYGGINKTLDASLEEVLTPNNNSIYAKDNSVCGQPTVHVHNAGSTAITSIRFDYGVVGSYIGNYTWSGNLAPLQDTIVALPTPWQLQADAGLTGTRQFITTITQVNGQADQDETNNSITTNFTSAPLWAPNLVVNFRTSGFAVPEDWKLYDMDGNLVAQRINAAQNTSYKDTLALDIKCYKLVVETPDGFGLVPANYTNLTGTGSISVTKLGTAAPLALTNYKNGDFGNAFTQYFTTSAWKAGVTNVESGKNVAINAYPNPATNTVTVALDGYQQVKGTLQLIDAVGRVVLTQTCTNATQTLNVSPFANGLYTIVYTDDNAAGKIQARLLIAK